MPFTGKATYSAGADLPEHVDDVADLVAIAAANETPLLDLLGDPLRPARGVVHEWMEDTPLANTVTVGSFTDGEWVGVNEIDVVRQYDLIRIIDSPEVMRVESVATPADFNVSRQYGNTPLGPDPAAGLTMQVLSNPTLEGADAAASRFTNRTRQSNTTQIFASTVEVSGSELAVAQAGVEDELEYQKAMRLRELLRDLELSIVGGAADASPPAGNPAGNAIRPRSMRGIVASVASHRFTPGTDGFPADTTLTEEQLNHALRTIWQGGGTTVDTIVVGGKQKRAINQFGLPQRRFASSAETYRDAIGIYESDFGVCRVVLSRAMPGGSVLLLDSSRASVLPLAGRSFGYKPLARTGDREAGQIIGEYTLELRNEHCHGLITGLS
ncbi:MAG: DUF5309 family protein [Planctomycetota bacterium]